MPTPPGTLTAPTPHAVLQVILYFDVFDHPLTETELCVWFGPGAAPVLAGLLGAGLLAAQGGQLFLPGRGDLVARRRQRAVAAERLWSTAHRSAAALSIFPWVRGVLVTGGLSKNSVAGDADVDFLLLVAPERVWLTKTALQLLRRALPPSGREALCTNYLLAEDRPEIPPQERDIYAAAEVVTARPLYGPTACRAFFDANLWVRRWFPAFDPGCGSLAAPIRPPGPRIRAVAHLDSEARRVWDRYWAAKYGTLSEVDFAARFRRDPHVSTNHLDDWRAPVLADWRLRLARHGIKEERL